MRSESVVGEPLPTNLDRTTGVLVPCKIITLDRPNFEIGRDHGSERICIIRVRSFILSGAPVHPGRFEFSQFFSSGPTQLAGGTMSACAYSARVPSLQRGRGDFRFDAHRALSSLRPRGVVLRAS
jgi:hypothetical protein